MAVIQMFKRLAASLIILSGVSICGVDPSSFAAKVHSPTLRSGVERIGTAWCLDKECSLMITNYHVAKFLGKDLVVNGETVESVSLATGPDDDGASEVGSFTAEVFKYATVRDLAILRMRSPMASKGMHGVNIFVGQLQKGEPVSIVSYPNGKLTVTSGRFDFADAVGVLQFQLSSPLAPGSSGGLILNDQGEAVGIVTSINTNNSKPVVFAVPIWSLAEFVNKSQPKAYATLFAAPIWRPDSSGQLASETPLHQDVSDRALPAGETNDFTIPEPNGLNPLPVLPSQYLTLATFSVPPQTARMTELREREEEKPETQALRQKAQALIGGMTNLIAVQTVTQANRSVQQHVVRVIDGQQVFVLPDGRQVNSMPDPKGAFVVPGSEWRDLPQTVGTNYRLPLRYLEERSEGGHRIKIFYFEATLEDKICGLRVKNFWKTWTGAAPCHGEVWTDADLNILRISEQMDLPPKSGLQSCTITILYGWLRHGGLTDRLVPASMRMATTKANTIAAESSTIFSEYHQFHATTRMMATSAETIVE